MARLPYSGGRWMQRDGAGVLYTSLAREGALAEISFHWGQLNPRPTKPVVLHRLRVVAHRTLRLVRADLSQLGVSESAYTGVNIPRTQEIGAAVEFLGCDGLIAPCARWACDNLMLFPDRMGVDATLEIVSSEAIDWVAWAAEKGLLT
nr:RES family NAD+ phosphorylase [Xenophilus azovorans]